MAAACIATAPLPKPDASADHVSVAIERQRTSNRAGGQLSSGVAPTILYESFWDAAANLDLAAADTLADDNDQRRFSAAMSLMLNGNLPGAENLLDSLRRNATDAFVGTAARVMLTAALQYQGKWSALANLPPDTIGVASAPHQKNADVELWARAFARVPARKLVLPPHDLIIPLSISRVGTPVIPVMINGREFLFWLDTGASMTILSSSAARDAGVTPIASDTLSIATAAGQVAAVPALVQKIEIGQMHADNAPGMIVDDELMQVRDSVSPTNASKLKIDGIIGWDIIRDLDLTIDFGQGILTIRRPSARNRSPNSGNLFWVGVPLVRFQSGFGRTVHLALDTGAEETFATQWLLEKAYAPLMTGVRKRVGGMGEDRSYSAQVISRIAFDLPGQTLVLRQLLVYAPAYWTFVHLDGVLGSDVARAGVMRIDATNHLFALSRN